MLQSPGPELFDVIKSLVNKPHPLILDIGANDGADTEKLLRLFDAPKIFAFEPEPRAIRRFKQRLDGESGVSLIESAVGRTTGSSVFYQSSGFVGNPEHDHPEGWDYSGSIRTPKEHASLYPWVKFEQQIVVPVVALDDWAREHHVDGIDFIWADVQGAEDDLILGGAKALARTRLFYTEYSNRELYAGQKGLDFISALLPQFEIHTLYEGDVLFRNTTL
jgi:FkbM family methyltransferase